MKRVYWRSIQIILLLIICCFALFYTSSCSTYNEDSPMIFKCAIDNPPGDMKSKTIKRMCDMIEAETNGRIQFQYFYSGSLIKKSQFVDAVARGIADISTGPVSFVTGKIPELSIFEIYGGYKLDKYVEIQKAVWESMKELFMPKGIYPLMFQYSGSAIFAHKSKFLKSPTDWKGQKMRLAGRWQSTLGSKKWGASSVFMEPADLYLALQRGTIEGYMLIWDIINGLKLYEVSPYIVDTGFSGNIEVVTMNLKKWQALTDTDKAIFLKAVDEVTNWTYSETLKQYENIRETLAEKGVNIYTLSQEEKSAYLKDVYELYPEIREVSGEIGNQFIDILESNGFQDK